MKNLIFRICYKIYAIGRNHDKKLHPPKYPSGISQNSTVKRLTIGEGSSFGGDVYLLGAGNIRIGDHTMIGARTIIHSSTHNHLLHPMNQTRIDKDVEIGSHVWIGAAAIILPGVSVGDYSVIGAGSVVTRDVPEMTIVAGNPARVLKQRNIKTT